MESGGGIECPIVRGNEVASAWEKGFAEHFNGKPIDKALQWQNLLTEDTLTVQSALSVCDVLLSEQHKESKYAFLAKLASVIPNSHSRNLLVQFYLRMVIVFEDDSDLLVSLVNFYPLSVTSINMFLRSHFLSYLDKLPNKGETTSEIIVWSKSYLLHVFQNKDIIAATETLQWISQFRYRAVHEFLLSSASTLTPRLMQPEYWLFLYKLLGVVVPGPPPTLISPNRYASVVLSVGAAVSSSCPLTPEKFLLMGYRMDYDTVEEPVLYKNISLTPGLAGLAAYTIIKHPTPSILPFIRNVLNIQHGVSIHLFGCFLYPLAILGSMSNDKIREEIVEMMTKILNMPRCSNEQRSYISQDDYADKCIKSQSTVIALKMGQILSQIAEKGVGLVEKQLQNAPRLTTFTAAVLCHAIAIAEDRPSDLLLSTFRLSDDATSIPLLTFITIHMKLIVEGKVNQSSKFYTLYIQNYPNLTKNASPKILKKMIKMMFSESGPFGDPKFGDKMYQVMWRIWCDHGGVVYTKLYSMLSNPINANLDVVVMSIVRRMCSGDRPVDAGDMERLILKYLMSPPSADEDSTMKEQVIGKCLDSLTYLCQGCNLDVRQIEHLISRYADDPTYSLQVCFFYSEFASELEEDAVEMLWKFTSSVDIATSAMAYKGLINSEVDVEITPEIVEKMSSLIKEREHPSYSAEFISKLLTKELCENPAQTTGVAPNPAKKLLRTYKVKDFFATKNLNLALFSFTPVTSHTSRLQHKKSMQQNQKILFSILSKFTDDNFNDPFEGIIMIEGWCHFMFEYIQAFLNAPAYNTRNRNDSTHDLLAHLGNVKLELYEIIERELQKSKSQMFVQVLIITSITTAVYRIANASGLPIEGEISAGLSKDIGLLRALTVYSHDGGKSSKTLAMLLLCSAYVARIACAINDEGLLKLLLEACCSKVSQDCPGDLLTQCAGVGTGVIVHVYYRIRPKTSCIKEAIQTMLDTKHYLGLSFCIDSLSNSIQKPATRKFIEEFIGETNKKSYVSPDRILFVGMLLVFSFYIDNADDHEIQDFLVYISYRIDTVSEEKEQFYYLLIQGLVLYNLSNWHYNQDAWKTAYEAHIEAFVDKFKNDSAAIPTLALLTGFPITNLVDCFNWGPNVFGVVKYTDNLMKSNVPYEDGRLCSLMIARSFDQQQGTLETYKKPPSNSMWDLLDKVISDSIVKQTMANKRKLRFVLKVLSNVSCKIPLTNPLQLMVSMFTRTTLQEEVVQCAGIHAHFTSSSYYLFLSKFLCLSVYPQLSLACQKQIILQIPNFIQLVPQNNLKYFFSRFLSETFWQGHQELRLTILSVLRSLLTSHPHLYNVIVESLQGSFFDSDNLHLLKKDTINEMSGLMRSIKFWDLPLHHLVAESKIVIDFIRFKHKSPDIVELFFTRYLQEDAYTAELLRAVVTIVLELDSETAYQCFFTIMTKVKKSLQDNPENFLNPAIACINMIVLTYVAYLKDVSSLGSGLEHFLYMSDLVEPQVNVDCLLEIMKNIEPWGKIIRMYDDVLLLFELKT